MNHCSSYLIVLLEKFCRDKFPGEGSVVPSRSLQRLSIDHVVILYTISKDATEENEQHELGEPLLQQLGKCG